MGQFSMEKPALKGQFPVEINTVAGWRLGMPVIAPIIMAEPILARRSPDRPSIKPLAF